MHHVLGFPRSLRLYFIDVVMFFFSSRTGCCALIWVALAQLQLWRLVLIMDVCSTCVIDNMSYYLPLNSQRLFFSATTTERLSAWLGCKKR